jgi:TonB family protein
MGRRLMGFLVLSLGAHAAAFSLFRDPGETSPLYPQGAGKVILSTSLAGDAGLADLFDPSAIVLPADQKNKLASTVALPWQGMAWPERPISPAPKYRPDEVGQDVPLAVKATSASPFYRIKSSTLHSSKGDEGAKTWWELSGDLRKRKPTKLIQLSAIKSANALEPTTARIGVDEDGAVRFVFLEGSTGDALVDREASSLIRTWRFQPAQGQWIEWGRVRILWAVEPPDGGKL